MLSKVIAQANIDHAEKWFERADKIVIVTHVSPDGDAIGSSLGLWHFLESQEKTVNVIVVWISMLCLVLMRWRMLWLSRRHVK